MVSSIYLLIRQSIIAAMPVVAQIQLIDNSLLGSENNSVRIATAFYILLQYFKLLIFPHPLSHDYSFAQISLQSLSSPPAIAAFLICIFLAIYAAMEMRKKPSLHLLLSFLYYSCTCLKHIPFNRKYNGRKIYVHSLIGFLYCSGINPFESIQT